MQPFSSAISGAITSLALALFANCGGDSTATVDANIDAPASAHLIRGDIKLTATNNAVRLMAQNGAQVDVPVADIVGKPYVFVMTPGGEPPANTTPIEVGNGVMPADLAVKFATAKTYADGYYEMAFFIMLSGGDPMQGPQNNDLAAFSLEPAMPGEQALTGTTVRVRVKGADTNLPMTNANFIRFTK
jgi:hypothetical protein